MINLHSTIWGTVHFAITNGTSPVARTVGLCVFAITHGMKKPPPGRRKQAHRRILAHISA